MNVRTHYCYPNTKNYPVEVTERSDRELEQHLFDYYPTLNPTQMRRTDYRQWRRCVIRELLRRGILAKDPGFGPPERS